jgi:Transport and Golgi organisation 2
MKKIQAIYARDSSVKFIMNLCINNHLISSIFNQKNKMCTLSFYPKSDDNGFILTFSRDEAAARSSVEIVKDDERGLVYPKDVLHGGTWLALSLKTGRLVCLLNGAFELHQRVLPYRKSRGLVVLESFDYADILDFYDYYDFENIEPFTLLTLQKQQVFQFRWDGTERHIEKLDPQKPLIRSSCTLYNKAVRQEREVWFSDYLAQKNNKILASDLWQFHKNKNEEAPEKGILMSRPSGPSTVSITQLNYSFSSQLIDFQYYELGNHDISHHQFAFGTNVLSV